MCNTVKPEVNPRHFSSFSEAPIQSRTSLLNFRLYFRDLEMGLLGQYFHFSSTFLSSITNPVILLFSISRTTLFNCTNGNLSIKGSQSPKILNLTIEEIPFPKYSTYCSAVTDYRLISYRLSLTIMHPQPHHSSHRISLNRS